MNYIKWFLILVSLLIIFVFLIFANIYARNLKFDIPKKPVYKPPTFVDVIKAPFHLAESAIDLVANAIVDPLSLVESVPAITVEVLQIPGLLIATSANYIDNIPLFQKSGAFAVNTLVRLHSITKFASDSFTDVFQDPIGTIENGFSFGLDLVTGTALDGVDVVLAGVDLIETFFTDPKQAFINFGETVEVAAVNFGNGVADVAVSFGKAIEHAAVSAWNWFMSWW